VREACALVAYTLRSSEVYAGLHEQTHKKALASPERRRQLDVLQKYEEFFQHAYDGIIVVDREYQVLAINPAGEQITGYARRGLVGTSLLEIVVEPDRGVLTSVLGEAGAKGAHSFDLRCMDDDGKEVMPKMQGQFNAPQGGGTNNLILNFQTEFPSPGRFTFVLRVDNVQLLRFRRPHLHTVHGADDRPVEGRDRQAILVLRRI
jgi:PAS domain S-box-containing protein